ncbi:MAG: hypothetical protein M1820_000023 [Bogoriella megaspora]|nr:MAG: hypothetical protein M1820_000023 [Bogoriella megaspora]
MSVAVHTGFLDGRLIILWWPWIFKIMPEIWRIFSSFILTGPQLGMIFDPYFLFTYGSSLERDSPRFNQPGDFFTYLTFIWAVILFLNGYLLGGVVFMNSLLLALAYTYAQENPNRQITFFVITFAIKYLPLAMMVMTFVMNSPTAAFHQSMGLVAAHFYEFLTKIWPEYGGGRSFIQTPGFVARWFSGDQPTPQTRSYGTAFAGRSSNQQVGGETGSSGVNLGSAGQTWTRRGQGHRLGGD